MARDRKRTPKEQARFDAATARAAQIARERHQRLEAQRRLEAERIADALYLARLDAARNRDPRLDDYWQPAEIRGNLYVLGHLAEYHAAMYGTPEVFN